MREDIDTDSCLISTGSGIPSQQTGPEGANLKLDQGKKYCVAAWR
jgi:hypothetical protein